MCVGKTLNMDSWFKFWGNLEGIWGNPGEMPHIGLTFWGNLEGIWGNPGEMPHIGLKIPGVYRVKCLFSHSELYILYGHTESG